MMESTDLVKAEDDENQAVGKSGVPQKNGTAAKEDGKISAKKRRKVNHGWYPQHGSL